LRRSRSVFCSALNVLNSESAMAIKTVASVAKLSRAAGHMHLRVTIISIIRFSVPRALCIPVCIKRNAIKLIVALAALFYVGPVLAAGTIDGPALNVATWFTWPRYQTLPATGIEWPPYKPERPGEAQLASLHAAGFQTIRLAVDPAPLIFFEGQRRDALVAMFMDTLKRLQKTGFKVIFDLQPNSRHKTWGDRALLDAANSTYLNHYADLVQVMAGHLSSFEPGTVALELINEPRIGCKGAEVARWQEIVSNLVLHARAGSKTLPVIVSGGCASTPDGLMALDPKTIDDKGIIYTFHYYEPFTFTHQGAQFIPWPDKYLDQVPWPYTRRPIEEPIKALRERLRALRMDNEEESKQFAAARNNIERYYAAKHTEQTIESKFSNVNEWARHNNIESSRVVVGEFGVWQRHAGLPGALCVDRAAWIAAVRQAAEKQMFGWIFFHLDGPFGLIDSAGKIDPVVLQALGLGTVATCSEN
jgi:endoglucanase